MERRVLVAMAATLVAVILAACGSDSSDSDDDADSGDNNSGGLVAPGSGRSSDSSSNNNSGNTSNTNRNQFGSATYKISGSAEASGELPFVPAASAFSNGSWVLTFGQESGDKILSLSLDPNTQSVLFGDGKISVTGVGGAKEHGCKVNIQSQSAAGAKGSFECANAGGLGNAGAIYADGIKVQVNFEARTK